VKCSIAECIKRDPKGQYDKALKGIIPNYTGVSAPYEEPENPDLIINTEVMDLTSSVQRVLDFLDHTILAGKNQGRDLTPLPTSIKG
jgi:adenylylsulfate kinase